MAHRYLEDAPVVNHGALGGAPILAPQPLPNEHDKAARKRRKREAKIRRDAARPPDSFERFRVLAELVKEGRQIIDLVDHRARYALVVIGALNAGVFLILSKGQLFDSVSAAARPWLIGSFAVYAATTVLFVYYAVDCLRPRRMNYGHLMAETAHSGESGNSGPTGVLYWETIATSELEAYQRKWSTVRMEQLNAEVVIIAHEQARLIREKYVVLGRLYSGLGMLVFLAGALLGAYGLVGS